MPQIETKSDSGVSWVVSFLYALLSLSLKDIVCSRGVKVDRGLDMYIDVGMDVCMLVCVLIIHIA